MPKNNVKFLFQKPACFFIKKGPPDGSPGSIKRAKTKYLSITHAYRSFKTCPTRIRFGFAIPFSRTRLFTVVPNRAAIVEHQTINLALKIFCS